MIKKYTAITSSKGIATFIIPLFTKTTLSSVKLTTSFKQKGVTIKAKKSVVLKMNKKLNVLNKTIVKKINMFLQKKKEII